MEFLTITRKIPPIVGHKVKQTKNEKKVKKKAPNTSHFNFKWYLSSINCQPVLKPDIDVNIWFKFQNILVTRDLIRL